MQVQKHCKGWLGDADTETLNTGLFMVQRMAGWCEYRNIVQILARWCGYRNNEHHTKDGQVIQIQKQWTPYKGWPGDVDTETLNTVQRMARWCEYTNMWIQKHWTLYKGGPGDVDTGTLYKGWPGDVNTETLYKGWPGDVDTETLNPVQRRARWCGYRNTEHYTEEGHVMWIQEHSTKDGQVMWIQKHCTKDGQVMWIQKHWTLYKGGPGDVDTETWNTIQRRVMWCGYRNTVQRRDRWCGYRNMKHYTEEGHVMWIQEHCTKEGQVMWIRRRVMWCGYRNTVQRMTRWHGYRNTAHCTMNGQETKKAEKLHANWSRKRQDSLLSRASDHEDKHNTDRVFNSLVHRGIFLPQSALSTDSLTVPVQPLCAIACINICAQMKNPKHPQPYHKNTAHTHRIWQHCSYAFCSHTQLR